MAATSRVWCAGRRVDWMRVWRLSDVLRLLRVGSTHSSAVAFAIKLSSIKLTWPRIGRGSWWVSGAGIAKVLDANGHSRLYGGAGHVETSGVSDRFERLPW